MSPRSSIISPPSETRWPRRAVLLADVREKEGESLAAALGTWVHGSGCVAGPLAAPRGQEGVIPPPAQRHRPPFVSTDRWGNRLPEGLRRCGGPERPRIAGNAQGLHRAGVGGPARNNQRCIRCPWVLRGVRAGWRAA